jgi:hypothetical protein
MSEPLVYWIKWGPWHHEGRIEPVRHRPFAIGEWRAVIQRYRYRVVVLPERSRVGGGEADGGQVVGVETGSGQALFALPPAALPFLADLLPADDYAFLQQQAAERGP